MATLVVITIFVSYEEIPTPSDLVDYGTWLFSLIGVFGYAYSIGIIRKPLWQAWLPIVVLWDIGSMAYQQMHDPIEMEPWFIVIIALIAAIMLLPEYLALYLYGYRSNSLWTSKT